MIIQVGESLQKTCPLLSIVPVQFPNQQSNFCRGEKCMMWRWHDPAQLPRFAKAPNSKATDENVRNAGPAPLQVTPEWTWVPYDPDNENYEAGCGLSLSTLQTNAVAVSAASREFRSS